MTVTTLSQTSISAINGHIYNGDELLAIGVPAMITGLVISSTDYPCTMGYVSRWIQNSDDEAACYASYTPAEGTKAAFEHLLGYAVSNNEAGILDVLMVSMHAYQFRQLSIAFLVLLRLIFHLFPSHSSRHTKT